MDWIDETEGCWDTESLSETEISSASIREKNAEERAETKRGGATNLEDHLPLVSEINLDDLLRRSRVEILDPDTLESRSNHESQSVQANKKRRGERDDTKTHVLDRLEIESHEVRRHDHDS